MFNFEHLPNMFWILEVKELRIKYSVVIPTFNRKEQLMLTLAAFENQTFPFDQLEVIVIDDGSTDGTSHEISNYHPSYTLRYVSTGKWSGIPAAWNLGVKDATGQFIIFCDADFLVLPNFIQTHHNYLVKYPNAIISSIPNCGTGIYLQIFPEYTLKEKEWMASLLRPVELWNDSYFEAKQVVNIVSVEDVRNYFEKVLKAVCPMDYFPKELREEYNRSYGMLLANNSTSKQPWQWIENPWPWQKSFNFDLQEENY
jgi:glycosyltransferase involved in cell wall biosynthesis